jgi:hypothetical protein
MNFSDASWKSYLVMTESALENLCEDSVLVNTTVLITILIRFRFNCFRIEPSMPLNACVQAVNRLKYAFVEAEHPDRQDCLIRH